MAKKTYRPGRNLVIFFLGVGVLYGLVALGGNWKPELGLDLQGGTRITLIATGDVKKSSLNEARKIIDQRVNASGVAESEVTTQGSKFIVVEIPGKTKRDLVETVKRQAQLRFRLVAGYQPGVQTTVTTPTPSSTTAPTGSPTAKPSSTPSAKPSGTPTSTATKSGAAQRPAPFVRQADPTPTPTPTPSGKSSPSILDAALPSTKGQTLDQTIAWAASPPEAWTTKFSTFECPKAGVLQPVDNPDQPLITCDEDGGRYLLTKAVIEGTSLKTASAGIPQGELEWTVNLTLSNKVGAVSDFTKISQKLLDNKNASAMPTQFAIVLDGQVLSAPQFTGVITDGKPQITGDFTESTAKSLANSLKFGSLPVAFEKDPSSETIGPSLAGDQLSTGLLAGAIGLFAVMIYCLIYYRGLGLVVLASLALAAAITYSMVLLLSKTAGFTLTLPGIAGLIIGVGVTADSFVIFFERIRDEMREGRSMRVAVETGWKRARQTRMAANVVSLLSAGVLYIFATGVVKGFGFALGLSTAIDLAVLFWFTKPAVSYLARFKFFNGGGELSGLSANTLGMDAIGAGTHAGGKA
ncbi:preprotein translocase subunit SecD [Marmoricola sp. OAE513]|uniref:protein translocase subunit SecD n=1 Tax=Marmoricola sp. OAE513 TaxID=2817894 RepID=UPI001AE305CB